MLDESSFLNPSREHTKYGCRKEMVLNREKDCQLFDNMCNRFKNYINNLVSSTLDNEDYTLIKK